MKRSKMRFVVAAVLWAAGTWCWSGTARADTVDFEDVGAGLAPGSYWNGSPTTGNETFDSRGATFNNYYDNTYGPYWEGWAYSNRTYNPGDYVPGAYNPGNGSVPTGPSSQYHAVPGQGAGGSGTYGLGYIGFMGATPTITLPAGAPLQSAMITNNNFAYYSMLEGDPPGPYAFAKKFGGTTGNDPDWFLLTITGKNGADQVVGTVEFYLADFRFSDNGQDYILDEWTLVDLSSLGAAGAVKLEFGLTSSDNSTWGMNTPAYFAIDDITLGTAQGVPEPSTLVLAGLGAVLLLSRRRRGG